jgi:HEAT repeat protein
MKFKIIDKEKSGFARYCPTFARGYEVVAEGIMHLKVKRLVKRLGETDQKNRIEAADELDHAARYHKADISIAIPDLLIAIGDETAEIRRSAVFPLGCTVIYEKSRDAVLNVLVRALGDENKDVCARVEFALGDVATTEICGDVVVNALVKALGNEKKNVRFHAAMALICAAEKGTDISFAIPALMMALGTDNGIYAAEALGNAAVNENCRGTVLNALVKVIVDENVRVRKLSALALGIAANKNYEIRVTVMKALMDLTNSHEFMVEVEKNSDVFIRTINEIDRIARKIDSLEREAA